MNERPFYTYVKCFKHRGGKNAFWTAKGTIQFLPIDGLPFDSEREYRIVGAGNSANNAIADAQKQARSIAKRVGLEYSPID